jgi:hypothetical protein
MFGKKRLSVEEMRAAIYARGCDLDHELPGRARADFDEKDGYKGSLAQYEQGKAILEKYTLRFDHRSTVHTMSDGRIPGQDEGKSGVLRRQVGHTATAQAYETAIFNPR